MTNVSIVFSSGRGRTRTVAHHTHKGATAFPNSSAELIEIVPSQLSADGRWLDQKIMDKLLATDAIVFGAPTFMGSAHGLFKLFLETELPLGSFKDGRTRSRQVSPIPGRVPAIS